MFNRHATGGKKKANKRSHTAISGGGCGGDGRKQPSPSSRKKNVSNVATTAAAQSKRKTVKVSTRNKKGVYGRIDVDVARQASSMSKATYGDTGSSKIKKMKKKQHLKPAPSSTRTNNNNNTWKKQAKHVKTIKLPTDIGTQHQLQQQRSSAAWWRKYLANQQPVERTMGTNDLNVRLLNSSLTVNAAALRHLNEELEAFAQYVRLTPVERRAREYVIEEVQKSCLHLFGIDPDQVQVFGSFACPSVCIFESDIDLAIWGVVPEDVNNDNGSGAREKPATAAVAAAATHIRFGRSDSKLPPSQPAAANAVHPNVKKQERIAKWKAALDEMDRAVEQEPPTESSVKLPQKKSSSPVVDPTNDRDDDDKERTLLKEFDGTIESYGAQLVDEGSETAKVTEDDVTDGKSDTDVTEDEKKPPAVDNKVSRDDSTVNDPEALFVIDRVGDPQSAVDLQCAAEANGQSSGASATPVVSNRSKVRVRDNETKEEEVKAGDRGDEIDGNESDVESTSDDDTADKLKGLQKRAPHAGDDEDDDEDDEVEYLGRKRSRGEKIKSDNDADDNDDDDDDEVEYVGRKRPRGQSVVSLCSATTCSDDEKVDDSGMEVSYMVHPKKKRASCEGRARTLVVNALYKLTKMMRPLAVQNKLHVRKKARVPILNMETFFGYECDIAMGGYNGTDTSSFATAQTSRFQSFSALVVVLKVLLNQHGLDKPFTGGIGSYALYVLVASHVERHLDSGGGDSPAELLFAFLFRYGSIKHNNRKLNSSIRTNLFKGVVIETTDGGTIDFSACYQMDNCVALFEACWWKLYNKLQRADFNRNHSMLQYVVDSRRLEVDRVQKKMQATDRLKVIFGAEGFRREMESRAGVTDLRTTAAVAAAIGTSARNKWDAQDGEGTIPGGLPPLDQFEPYYVLSEPNVDEKKTGKTKSREKQKKGRRLSESSSRSVSSSKRQKATSDSSYV